MALVAGAAAALALAAALGVGRVHDPPEMFRKYLDVPERMSVERVADFSPLYLGLTRALEGLGATGLLVLQCLAHAATAALVALAVARLAGWRWALAAGAFFATYRPALVHAGVHEPETLLLLVLAGAVVLGLAARDALSRDADLRAALPCAGAALLLALATTLRPTWLLLLPAWLWWMAARSGREGRRLAAVSIVAVGLAVLGPLLAMRWYQLGSPVLMNPGPVLYEGNGPAATGLLRHAPEVVLRLELANDEPDYGHVAYRRLASFARSHHATVGATNRYWAGLTLEAVAARPAAAAGRLAFKASRAFSPREVHDVRSAVQLDRRLRPLLPWGFGVLLLAVPCIALCRRTELASLAGPLCIAVVAVLSQVVFYASSRQRLPLALALAIVGPVLAARALSGGLRGPRWLTPALGIAFAVLVTLLGARSASLERAGWTWAMGPASSSPGERLSAWLDGARWSRAGEAQLELRRCAKIVRTEGPDAAAAVLPELESLAARHADLTMEHSTIAVAEYWRAQALRILGRRDEAAAAAARAAEIRPGDVMLLAYARRLSGPLEGEAIESGENWRPPGVDPASARWARMRAAALDGDPRRASRLSTRFMLELPELTPQGTEDAAP